MNFLNPWALFGLIASSAPIIIHLLNLRKLKTVEFSDLRFLKELQKTRIKRLKIKQILLLILRALILAFLALALSRPTMKTLAPVFGSHAPTSAIIIIDDSPSMSASDEKGARFKRAQNIAASLLSKLSETDEAAIIKTSESKNPIPSQFSKNFANLREETLKMRPVAASGNLEDALKQAAADLKDAKNYNQEVFIISDFQKTSLLGGDTNKFFAPNVSLYTVPISGSAEVYNIGIDTLELETKLFRIGKPLEIKAKLQNYSNKDANVSLSLFLNDEKTAQRSIDLPAKSQKTVEIASNLKSAGLISGRLEIDNDGMDFDNKRYFSFAIPKAPKIALIGDANSLKYLELAFLAGQDESSINKIAPNKLSSISFNDYDAIVIAGEISSADWTRAQKYLTDGGDLLIFANAVNKSDGASILSKFGFAYSQEKRFSESSPARFSRVDKKHPIFEGVFKDEQNSQSVDSPDIYAANPVGGGQAIIEMPGGAFLAENKVGLGKVIYCAVAPNTDNSTFPLTGIFPTTIFQIGYYLSSEVIFGEKAIVGDNAQIFLPKKSPAGAYQILYPDKTQIAAQALSSAGGAYLNLGAINQTGVYIVNNSQNQPITSLDANLTLKESNLELADNNEIKKVILSYSKNSYFENIKESDDAQNYIARAKSGVEIWRYFAIGAIICAILEMIVARASKKETEGIS